MYAVYASFLPGALTAPASDPKRNPNAGLCRGGNLVSPRARSPLGQRDE